MLALRVGLLALLVAALGGCGPDPCQRLEDALNTCGETRGGGPTQFKGFAQRCRQVIVDCTADDQQLLVRFADCNGARCKAQAGADTCVDPRQLSQPCLEAIGKL